MGIQVEIEEINKNFTGDSSMMATLKQRGNTSPGVGGSPSRCVRRCAEQEELGLQRKLGESRQSRISFGLINLRK